MKLTLVSIYSHGVKVSAFVNLPVSPDGKVRISERQAHEIFSQHAGWNLRRGDTYSIGA